MTQNKRLPLHPRRDRPPGLEDAARAGIANRLCGAPAIYLPGTDRDSDPDQPPQMATRQPKHGVRGKLRKADTVVVKTLTWSHEVLYTPSSQPIAYESISSMTFCKRVHYCVGQRAPPQIRAIRLSDLHELMADG